MDLDQKTVAAIAAAGLPADIKGRTFVSERRTYRIEGFAEDADGVFAVVRKCRDPIKYKVTLPNVAVFFRSPEEDRKAWMKKWAAEWPAAAARYRLDINLLGTVMERRYSLFRILGAHPNRARSPFVAEEISTGDIYAFPASAFNPKLQRKPLTNPTHGAVGVDGKPLSQAFFPQANHLIQQLDALKVPMTAVLNACTPDREDKVRFENGAYLSVGSTSHMAQWNLFALLTLPDSRYGTFSGHRWDFMERLGDQDFKAVAQTLRRLLQAKPV